MIEQSAPTTVLEEALDRFNFAVEAEADTRMKCLDDLEFSTGNQWPLGIRSQREIDGRPCLTMDQLTQSIRIVCNEYRQLRPAVQVNPVGNGADTDTAEILQGIIRHIEVNSDAEIAYDWAHECVVRNAFGSWRILSDYADDETDGQEIFIKKIRNSFSVYWQPGVEFEDAAWCFVIADIPVEIYKQDYKDSQIATMSDFTAIGNTPPEWITKEYIRVAEYFTVETERRGKGRPKKTVKWRKLNAVEILEGGEDGQKLPGTSIPILTAVGDDIDVDGKRYLAGLVRNGKDPQRQYNYMVSAATESVALAPKAPWIVAEGQLAGYEKLWEVANTRNLQVLTYKQTDVGGKPAPPPQRNSVEPPIQALAGMIQQAGMDLKASLGIYDPSLGQRKGDESGTAIQRLQTQGSLATLNFSDNVARTMRRHGKLLLEWIREIYDVPKVQRIIKPDGSTSQVIVHSGPEQEQDAQQLMTDENKIKKIYDIGVGSYDVTVSVGPSYQTKRQEAVESQLDFLKTIPPQMAVNYIDLVTANMDWPQAREFSARAKKMLPPQLQDNDSDPQVQLQQAQAQLQQLAQQHQLMTKALGEATDVIKTKQIEHQGKFQIAQMQENSAIQQTRIKTDAQITVAEITTKAQDALERFKELNQLNMELHGAAHELGMQKDQQGHESQMAQQQQAAATQAQQSDQQADAASQASDQQQQQTMAQQNQGGTNE